MLQLTIAETDLFDEETQEFYKVKEQTLVLEHSLLSISKWEANWHIPYLDDSVKRTEEQIIDYIKCMTINQNVDPNVYLCITPSQHEKINRYILDPMTATWFNDKKEGSSGRGGSSEVITSELIYYWMISLNIPVEFQKWHLNRLITLIKVCGIKNSPDKKMSMNDILRQNKSLNEARKAKFKSRG